MSTTRDLMDFKLELVFFKFKEFNNDVSKLRNAIHPSEMWRFFIDGDRHREGWAKFEDEEPGYLVAMIRAFQKIFEPVDDIEDLIVKLHTLAGKDVKLSLYDEYECESLETYSKTAATSPPIGYYTYEGAKELLETVSKSKNTDEFFILCLLGSRDWSLSSTYFLVPDMNNGMPTRPRFRKRSNGNYVIENFIKVNNENFSACHYMFQRYLEDHDKSVDLQYYIKPDGNRNLSRKFKNHMKQFEHDYKNACKNAASPLEKLRSIASYIRDCERLHPFHDGNTRTFSMLLLNHLLIHNKFPMAIRDNPNHSYAITVDELVSDIIDGMLRTLYLAQGIPSYKVKTDSFFKVINKDHAEAFETMVEIESKARGCDFERIIPIHDLQVSKEKASALEPVKNKTTQPKEMDNEILNVLKKNGITSVLGDFKNYAMIESILSTHNAKLEFLNMTKEVSEDKNDCYHKGEIIDLKKIIAFAKQEEKGDAAYWLEEADHVINEKKCGSLEDALNFVVSIHVKRHSFYNFQLLKRLDEIGYYYNNVIKLEEESKTQSDLLTKAFQLIDNEKKNHFQLINRLNSSNFVSDLLENVSRCISHAGGSPSMLAEKDNRVIILICAHPKIVFQYFENPNLISEDIKEDIKKFVYKWSGLNKGKLIADYFIFNNSQYFICCREPAFDVFLCAYSIILNSITLESEALFDLIGSFINSEAINQPRSGFKKALIHAQAKLDCPKTTSKNSIKTLHN